MTYIQEIIDSKLFNLQSVLTSTINAYIIVSSAENGTIITTDDLQTAITNYEMSDDPLISQDLDPLTVNGKPDDSKLALTDKYLNVLKYEPDYIMGAHVLFAEHYDENGELVLVEVNEDTVSELYSVLQEYKSIND